MYLFCSLNKNEKEHYLPRLFDILYSNMKDIAPSGLSYDEERAEFLLEVSSALDKEPRKIVLCYSDDELIGFLMYYTRQDLLMIEELQLVKRYQRTRAFYSLCRYMKSVLPENIELVESFVHKSNENSISLQKWLGLDAIEQVSESLLHLRGRASYLKQKIK